MKKLVIVLIFAKINFIFAQTDLQQVAPTAAPPSQNFEYHQIYFEKPVQRIDKIEYKKDGTLIDGKIMQEGKFIYLKNYNREKGSIIMRVSYKNGLSEEIIKSICTIDPVIDL